MKKTQTPAQQAFRSIALALHELHVHGIYGSFSPVVDKYNMMPRGHFGPPGTGASQEIKPGSVLFDIFADETVGKKFFGHFYGYRSKNKLFRFQVQFRWFGTLPGFANTSLEFSCSISKSGLVYDGPVVEGGQSKLFMPKTMYLRADTRENPAGYCGVNLDNPGVVTTIAIDWTGTPSPEQAFNGTKWLADRVVKEVKEGRQLLSQPETMQQIFDQLASSVKRKNGRRNSVQLAHVLVKDYKGPKPEKLIAALLAGELAKTG